MQITVLDKVRTIIENPTGKHNYFGWPSVTRLPDGKIAAVCSGFRLEHICPFGKAVMALSEDNGKTYSAPAPIIDTPLDDRDSGIMTFGETGVLVTSFNNTRLAQRNWNPLDPAFDEKTLEKNRYIHAYLDTVTDEDEARFLGATFRVSLDGGKTFGPLHISPITSPHGPCQLQDGTILWLGRTFSEDDMFAEDRDRVMAFRVSPDGTMEHLGTVPPIYRDGRFIFSCEPHAIQLPEGRILCHIRVQDGKGLFTVYQSVSDDGGITWSEPVQILGDKGGSPAHLLRHSSGVIISTYGYRQAPYGIRVMFSHDGGESWDADNVLWDEGVNHDLGYPCTMELADGRLLTVFYAKDEVNGPAVIKQIIWKIEQ